MDFSLRAGSHVNTKELPCVCLLLQPSHTHSLHVCHTPCSLKCWLSELVHLTCYRICARGLSATIHYHNKSVTAQCVHKFFSFPSFLKNYRNSHTFRLIGDVSSPSYRENKPQKGGICVANHTSPIDVVILANDGCYAMVSDAETWDKPPPS